MRRLTCCCVSLESLLIEFYVCLGAMLPLSTPSRAGHPGQRQERKRICASDDNGETLKNGSRIHVDDLAEHAVRAMQCNVTSAFPVADEEPFSSLDGGVDVCLSWYTVRCRRGARTDAREERSTDRRCARAWEWSCGIVRSAKGLWRVWMRRTHVIDRDQMRSTDTSPSNRKSEPAGNLRLRSGHLSALCEACLKREPANPTKESCQLPFLNLRPGQSCTPSPLRTRLQ